MIWLRVAASTNTLLKCTQLWKAAGTSGGLGKIPLTKNTACATCLCETWKMPVVTQMSIFTILLGSLPRLLNREDGLHGIWHGTNTCWLDRAEWLDSDLKCTRTRQVQVATGVYLSSVPPHQNKAADRFVLQSVSCHQTSLLVSDVTVRYFSRT